MKRSEQDIRFQWDLTKIYPDTAAWETAMQEAEAALAPLKDLPGTLGTSKEAFQHGLDTVYASMLKVELPYIYAFLKKTEDGSVAENQEMAARSESLLVKFSAATAFLNPEILAIPAEKLDAWMQDEVLATYRHTVDDIVRMRAHTLDAAREQMLALLGDANGAGFLDVVDKYGSTPSGNLAKHYAGICYLRTGDLENAAKYLAKFSHLKGIPGALINAQNYCLPREPRPLRARGCVPRHVRHLPAVWRRHRRALRRLRQIRHLFLQSARLRLRVRSGAGRRQRARVRL